jgi:hypothetical protein
MTKKAKKINKSDIKEVKSDIDELVQKINSSDDFFVIGKEVGYLVVGTVNSYKIRIEKSGNIFQPFGKNVDKDFPIYFPIVTDAKKASSSEVIIAFRDFEIPILHINKHQMKLDEYEIKCIMQKYFVDNFHCNE